jgi:uncharacterized damage-inducible protein DinB
MNELSRRALLRNSLIVAAAASVPAIAQKAASAPAASANPEIDELKRAFATSHTYTIDMANVMPEDKYHFKPVNDPEIRTFGQQMVHIADVASVIFQHFVEGKPAPPGPKPAQEQFAGKADVLLKLETAYKYVEDAIAKMSDSDLNRVVTFFGKKPAPVRQVMHTILDHCTHHRAQTIVYIRLSGLKPAEYRA